MERGVLFITHDMGRSGAPILLLHLLQWLRANSDLRISTLCRYGGALEADFGSVGPIFNLQPPSSQGAGRVRQAAERLRIVKSARMAHEARLRDRLLAEPIRLIYANTLACGPELDFALRVLGPDCPVICHAHELEYAIQRLGKVHTERVFDSASQYVAVSEAVRDNLEGGHGVPLQAIKVIYGFVPTTPLEPRARAEARRTVREELGLSPETLIVCGGGATEWRKGTDIFVNLAKATRTLLPDFPLCFLWVGGRSEEQYFQEVLSDVRGLKAEEYVRFIGQRPNLPHYFSASDIFALTSREDPFPLVALEAGAAELPVVCFAGAGGTPEFVRDECGIIVPYLDWMAMAQSLSGLLRSAELRRTYGTNAADKVRRAHSVPVGSRQILDLIHQRLTQMEVTSSGTGTTTSAV